MKKILSMLLALAMVLTMAAFPAFADDVTPVALSLVSYSGTKNDTSASQGFQNMTDGNAETHWISDQYGGSLRNLTTDLVFELETPGMLDTLIIKWGAKGQWGRVAPDAYNISVSSDNKTWNQILTYSDLYSLAVGDDGHINVISTSAAYRKIDITETGLNAKDVKYIRVEIRRVQYAVAMFEIEAYTKDTAALVPATYTVKYQYADGTEALAPKTVEGNFVGDTVKETAPAITGYNVDEASKELTLVDGTNEIVFTYTARPAATYTVEYVDVEGNPVADAKEVTTGFYADDKVTETAVTVAGYKPTETSKEVTLAAGANTITFTYNAAESVTYTVNYVDAAGNPIADAKTVTAYEGDEVTEAAATVAGYFLDGTEFAKKITLAVDAENEITFTYKKVLVPTKVSATYAAGVSTSGGNSSDWASLYDGNVNRHVQYAPVGSSYVAGTSPMIVTYAFAGLTDFTKLTTLSNTNRADSVKVYTSMNGTDWTEVGTYEPKTAETKVVYTKADGSTVTTYVNEYDLTGKSGTQVRFEVLASPAGAWCGIYEMMVEGSAATPVALSADKVVAPNWGWTTSGITDGTAGTLFDGAAATNAVGFFNYGYYGASSQPEAGKSNIEIDLGAVYDNPIITIQGGASDWNYVHLMAYEIYVADIDGVYGEAPVSGFDNGTNADVNKVRTDMHQISAEGVRYVKIVPTYMLRRTVLGEISVYGVGTPVEAASYTVEYVDEEGNKLAEDKTVEGLLYNDKVTENAIDIEDYTVVGDAKKTVTLAAGENTITFTYKKDKVAVTYTVKYVDAAGNEIAPAKVVTDKFAGDEVTEYAVVVGNYTADTSAETITLVEGTNEIVFTYTKTKMQSLGGTIRIPSAKYSKAGIRFGATLEKNIFGDEAVGKSYNYTKLKEMGITVGMMMLPEEMLDGKTLTEYLANGVQDALDVPAKWLQSETAETIEFTAVLTEIPTSEYDTEIVAVPYVCVNGNYTYFTEMTRSFNGVANAIADAYEDGRVSLTPDELDYIQNLLNRVLVVG